MKKLIPLILIISQSFYSQSIANNLDTAIKKMMASPSAYSASLSVYIAHEDGSVIYENNGNKGLSTASTQKIFTAAAALETLGKDYQYLTKVLYSGTVSSGSLLGDVVVTSNGDPTLGSWRYEGYKPQDFKQKFIQSFKDKGINKISGDVIVDDLYFDFQTIPGGWPWNDLGNYYGAGVWGLNWKENQFDIQINGGEIKKVNIDLPNLKWVNDIKNGGNSDQSFIFTAPHSEVAYINGTLPAKALTVSGANPNPPLAFGQEVKSWFAESGIVFNGKIISTSQQKINGEKTSSVSDQNILLEYKSPTLDQIIFWFMRKSINFYGETIIKTLGKEKRNAGSFEAGISYLKDFWKTKGINPVMMNFADGSGLSPQNYVSAKAEVQSLLWSKKQAWFNEFFDGFPIQGNGMKMKSGTMKDTKSFAGYHTSKNGKKYVFAIIINNYQGGNVNNALFQVLNVLK